MQYQSITKIRSNLIRFGGELFKNVVIKKITITDIDSFKRIILMVDKPIKQLDYYPAGKNKEVMRNRIILNTYSIRQYFNCNSNTSMLKNIIADSPKLLHLILEGAEIDIIAEHVSKNQEYYDRFNPEVKPITYKQDVIKHHIFNIRLTQLAFKIIDKIESLMWDAINENCLKKRIELSDAEIDDIIFNDYKSMKNKNPFMTDEYKNLF